MKKQFINAQVEVVNLTRMDIIVTSGGSQSGGNEYSKPII